MSALAHNLARKRFFFRRRARALAQIPRPFHVRTRHGNVVELSGVISGTKECKGRGRTYGGDGPDASPRDPTEEWASHAQRRVR